MGGDCVWGAVEWLVADGAHERVRVDDADEASATWGGVDDGTVEADGVWRADIAVQAGACRQHFPREIGAPDAGAARSKIRRVHADMWVDACGAGKNIHGHGCVREQ